MFKYNIMPTKEAVMTTQDVANRFNELAQQGNWTQVQQELYADNAVSIEPAHSPGLKTVEGKEAIKKKGEEFQKMTEEVHGAARCVRARLRGRCSKSSHFGGMNSGSPSRILQIHSVEWIWRW